LRRASHSATRRTPLKRAAVSRAAAETTRLGERLEVRLPPGPQREPRGRETRHRRLQEPLMPVLSNA